MYADGSANDISNDIAFTIVCSEDCYVYGNIMSLQSSTNFADLTNITENWAFAGLFSDIYNGGNNKIRNHSEKALLLPATTLSENCYRYMFKKCTELTSTPALPATSLTSYCYMEMFRGCTSLTTTTQLPATTLASHCYDGMFNGCTSLTIAPALPATSLTESCYDYMFKGCTSLTSAPELPATELATNCYSGMFIGCTGITNAPELPATTLAQGCYNLMFSNCTGLTSAPDLIAPTLVNTCYRMMFQNCSSLTYVKCLATNISAQNATEEWLSGTASTGTRTFVKANGADWSSASGTSGIPSGWTTQTAEPEYSITLPGNITGGSVTKSPSSNTVTAGTSVTLTASPSTGYQFGSITVTKANGGTVTTSGTGNSRTFSMPAENVTVSATFTQINYTVSVGSSTNGSVSASKTSNAHYGESITLTVNPSTGYQLSTLTYTVAGGSPVSISGTGNSRSFNMPAGNVTVSASFTPASYSITTTTPTGGTLSVNSTAAYNSSVSVTVTPNSGYQFESLTVTKASGGTVTPSGTGTTRTFTMPAVNVTVSAIFTPASYSITTTTPTGGTLSVNSTAAYHSTVSLTVTPNSGCQLESLTVTKASGGTVTALGSDTTRTFTMPAENVTVSATFKASTKSRYDTLNVGDIYLNDDTIVSFENREHMSSSQKANAIGVIFDAQNKKFIGLTIEQKLWCTSDANLANNNSYNESDTDGATNTQQIKSHSLNNPGLEKYPAFKFLNELGSNGSYWYMPAKEEAKAIFSNLTILSSAFTAIDKTLPISAEYSGAVWTSTRGDINNSSNVVCVYGANSVFDCGKTSQSAKYVCPVHQL